jgi:hypothetical protein
MELCIRTPYILHGLAVKSRNYLGHRLNSVVLTKLAMLSGSLVTTAWRVLRLRMEEKASRYGG